MMQNLLSVGALLISLATFFFSYWELRRQNNIAEDQAALQDAQTRLHRDLDVTHWAQACVDLLVEAWALCRDAGEGLGDDTARRATQLQDRISSAIDRGRFFLPNLKKDEHRSDVLPKSRQGYRHAALDELVAAYDTLEKVRRDPAVASQVTEGLFENRRWFVDAVIEEIQAGLHVALGQRITQRQEEPQSSDAATGARPAAKLGARRVGVRRGSGSGRASLTT